MVLARACYAGVRVPPARHGEDVSPRAYAGNPRAASEGESRDYATGGFNDEGQILACLGCSVCCVAHFVPANRGSNASNGRTPSCLALPVSLTLRRCS